MQKLFSRRQKFQQKLQDKTFRQSLLGVAATVRRKFRLNTKTALLASGATLLGVPAALYGLSSSQVSLNDFLPAALKSEVSVNANTDSNSDSTKDNSHSEDKDSSKDNASVKVETDNGSGSVTVNGQTIPFSTNSSEDESQGSGSSKVEIKIHSNSSNGSSSTSTSYQSSSSSSQSSITVHNGTVINDGSASIRHERPPRR